MTFLWPGALLLLGLVPFMIGLYVWSLRRKRVALRYSSLSLVRAAIPQYSRLRRHLPFALFLLALGSLVVTMGRPVQIVYVPSGQTTIVLALDVSGSMRQQDVLPSRLQAAKAAALSFIGSQKASARIALVAFAGYAELIQPATTDRQALERAVKSLTIARGTAIGSGILESLDAIAEIDPNVAPSVLEPGAGEEPVPVPQGAYVPHIIVLLTDGVTTTGPEPLDAARQAVDRGVRVYTIGFGTENGQEGFGRGGSFGGGSFNSGQGQPGGGFGGFRRGIDEETLKQIADMSGGKYYAAESASDLVSVFESLPTSLITVAQVTEISVLFAAAGALLAALAITFALRWQPLL
jgi:Ca-activated chloride channel family protein